MQTLKSAGCFVQVAPFGAQTLQHIAFFPSPSIISITHELTSGLHDSKTLIKALSK